MNAEILPFSSFSIERAIELLNQGELVAIPTETVYGLAGYAFDQNAMSKIFKVKERPFFDPLIVHIPKTFGDLEALSKARLIDLGALSPAAKKLAESLISHFWPGPLTIVLPRHDSLPDIVTSGLSTVGIRMPEHAQLQELLVAFNRPLAAPSANLFGRISPTLSSHVFNELGDRIKLILDGGPATVGVESTIVGIDGDASLILLRPGGLALSAIEQVTGLKLKRLDKKNATILAPGMTAKHYAPGKPLILIEDSTDPELQHQLTSHPDFSNRLQKIGLLRMSPESIRLERLKSFIPGVSWEEKILTSSSDSMEAAHRLFSVLRYFDEADIDLIIATRPHQSSDLWPAITDRLERASASPHTVL